MLHRGATPRPWKFAVVLSLATLAGTAAAQTRTLAAHGQPEELTLLSQLKQRPRDGSLWFRLGVVRAEHGETTSAIPAFERAASLLQDKLSAYRNVVALALKNNDLSLALLTSRRALALYPEDQELLQNDAYALVSTSKFAEAEAPLRTLERLNPADVAVRVSLISALQHAGDATQSDAELQQLFQASLLSQGQAVALERDFERQNNLHAAEEAAAYIAQTWPADSIADSAAHIPAAAPSSPSASFHADAPAKLSDTIARATELIHAERYLDAMHFLADATAQFPNQPELQYQSALTDVCLQRYPEAIAALQQMKQQGSDSAKVDFLLGGSYEILGQDDNAGSAYRAASALDPENFLYDRVLGALLQKEGKFADSSEPLSKALALQPDDSGSLVLLARTQEKAGDLREAASLLEHAIRSDPKSRRAHAALAALYFRQKRITDAEQEQAIAATLEDQRIQQWTIWGADSKLKN